MALYTLVMSNPEFMGLVHMLQATAEAALGDINASTARANRDGLLSSEHSEKTVHSSLKLLLMLAEKTKGNLDFAEADVLSSAISALRSRMESK